MVQLDFPISLLETFANNKKMKVIVNNYSTLLSPYAEENYNKFV